MQSTVPIFQKIRDQLPIDFDDPVRKGQQTRDRTSRLSSIYLPIAISLDLFKQNETKLPVPDTLEYFKGYANVI